MGRLNLIGRRLVQAIPSIAGIIVVTFLLTRALPGDPAVYFAGPAADAQSIAQIRAVPHRRAASGAARCYSPMDSVTLCCRS